MHQASEVPTSRRKHIGALIDNRKGEPVLLIQKSDLKDTATSRLVYVRYFDGTKDMEVRIISIFKRELL